MKAWLQESKVPPMCDPDTHVFSAERFRTNVKWCRRGFMTEDELLTRFLWSFDPDAVHESVGGLPRRFRSRLRRIVRQSPSTEEEWFGLRLAWRRRRERWRKRRGRDYGKRLGEPLILGRWGDYFSPESLPVPLGRSKVHALRTAFGLPCHEPPWNVWHDRYSSEIDQLGLHPWVLSSCTHWYYYLDNPLHTFSIFDEHFGTFASNPVFDSGVKLKGKDLREYSYQLSYKGDFDAVDISSLERRLRFVREIYPKAFTNAKYHLVERIARRKRAQEIASAVNAFLRSDPKRFRHLIAQENTYGSADMLGYVSSVDDRECIKRYCRDELPLIHLDYMLDSVRVLNADP